MSKVNFTYTNLTPFKWFVLENFPFIEADFDALTNWQLFCKLGKEINKIIKSVNTSGEQVETLTNAFNNLQNYVNNYFDNLDVQEEVNNKLDQMAQSGELTELLTAYLNLKCIYGFNTVDDMIKATNLVDGSFCKTYGRNTLNDGYGQFYKVRQITSSDIVDGYNIVALDVSSTLIAEKMKNQEIIDLTNEINEIKNNNKILTKTIFIGDSYGSANNNWITPLIEKLNYSENDYYKNAMEGSGFVQKSGNTTFLTLLTNTVNQLTNDEKQKINSVIVCGGANDNTESISNIETAIDNFVTYVNTNLPNAKIYLGEIGWTTNAENVDKYAKVIAAYKSIKKYKNCFYLNNVEYTLQNTTLITSDGVHPTLTGCNELATNIYDALLNGSCNVYYSVKTHNLNDVNVYEVLDNETVTVFTRNTIIKSDFDIDRINCSGSNMIIFNTGNQFLDYVVGGSRQKDTIIIPCYFRSNGRTVKCDCVFAIINKLICLFPFEFDPTSGYINLTNITGIYIPPFTYKINQTNYIN